MQETNVGGRPSCRSERARWYAKALEDQASSGLSVAEYAEEIGVTAATLYQWRRRLSAQGTDDPVASGPFGLVEVSVGGEVAPEIGGIYVVRLGRDREIEVPSKFAEAELRRLIRVVESC